MAIASLPSRLCTLTLMAAMALPSTTFAQTLTPEPQPSVAPLEAPQSPAVAAPSRPFYRSPWFWVAVGGAAVLGGTALIVSQLRDDTVPVVVQPPSTQSALSFRGDFL